jgi:hypothetical protein
VSDIAVRANDAAKYVKPGIFAIVLEIRCQTLILLLGGARGAT